jgi:centromeric protein E
MEARKARLTAQLAKLNGEILTSELPRTGGLFPPSPSRPKRRRISDFASVVGIGHGTPKKVFAERRAFSGLMKVEEDGGMVERLELVTEVQVTKVSKAWRPLGEI